MLETEKNGGHSLPLVTKTIQLSLPQTFSSPFFQAHLECHLKLNEKTMYSRVTSSCVFTAGYDAVLTLITEIRAYFWIFLSHFTMSHI